MADTLDTIRTYLASAVTEFAPRILGAVIVILCAFLVAFLLQRLAIRLLESVGLDNLFERTGASNSLWQLGYDRGPSHLLGVVLFWAVLLTGIAGALSVLELRPPEETMNRVAGLLGRTLAALAVMIGGVMAAGWLAELVARESERAGLRGSNVLRRIVFVTVVALTALVAAGQLGIQASILVLLATVLFATIGLVTALALGQGLVPLFGNIAAGRYVQEYLAVGDEISVNGIEGTVEELGYSAVVLRSEDGYLYRVPNRTFLEGVVRKKVESESA